MICQVLFHLMYILAHSLTTISAFELLCLPIISCLHMNEVIIFRTTFCHDPFRAPPIVMNCFLASGASNPWELYAFDWPIHGHDDYDWPIKSSEIHVLTFDLNIRQSMYLDEMIRLVSIALHKTHYFLKN